jgi:aspartate/methionine/tyrosine aminotransferase
MNLSQAAPIDPPPEALRAQMARMVVNEPDTHLYGPVLGLPALRAEIAERWSVAYGGEITAADVAITAGCNMAFCAALATLAIPGDAVLLPVPWYFNHKMWCDTVGIDAIPLPCDARMHPDPEAARPLMSSRVKAIVLITPNNPTGAEYPSALLAEFAALAREHGAALIVDETYRDFDSRPGRPHDLFTDPEWRDVLIHLYSFSKAFRLTGHRTGAVITSPERLAEVEKFLDSVAICAPTLGQKAALWGLRHLGDWVAGERDEILRRRDAITQGMARLPGWKLLGCGAYFAYVEHPFAMSSDELCKLMVEAQSILTLPGTMFSPDHSIETGGRQIRIAFANMDAAGLSGAIDRLADLTRTLPRRAEDPGSALASGGASA